MHACMMASISKMMKPALPTKLGNKYYLLFSNYTGRGFFPFFLFFPVFHWYTRVTNDVSFYMISSFPFFLLSLSLSLPLSLSFSLPLFLSIPSPLLTSLFTQPYPPSVSTVSTCIYMYVIDRRNVVTLCRFSSQRNATAAAPAECMYVYVM